MSLQSMCARTTVTLQVETGGKDTSGGEVKTPWTNVDGQQEVPCHIQPLSSGQRVQFAVAQQTVSHVIHLARDIGARPRNRLVEDSSGRIFLVQGNVPKAPGFGQWPASVAVEEQPYEVAATT